jgi:hypothetical protein
VSFGVFDVILTFVTMPRGEFLRCNGKRFAPFISTELVPINRLYPSSAIAEPELPLDVDISYLIPSCVAFGVEEPTQGTGTGTKREQRRDNQRENTLLLMVVVVVGQVQEQEENSNSPSLYTLPSLSHPFPRLCHPTPTFAILPLHSVLTTGGPRRPLK